MRLIWFVIPYFFGSLFINRTKPVDPSRRELASLGEKNSVYQFTMKTIDGKDESLGKYKGKVMVIINVASECGNTPQYEAIEAFYKKYAGKGVVVLGFPANNFGAQEPGTDADIKTFCTSKYSVTFPMFSKISVKGDDIHPLYNFLNKKELNGVEESTVKWNFQKYVVDKNGFVVCTFAPKMKVTDAAFVATIDSLLK